MTAPRAVGPLVGVRSSAPASLGARPGEKLTTAAGVFTQPWGSVHLARQCDWDSASQVSAVSASDSQPVSLYEPGV